MHGGDIYTNKVNMDFSVNINPLGLPKEVKSALSDAQNKADVYPDITNRQLRFAISKQTGADIDCIACGNGASELIMAFARMVMVKRGRLNALLVAPSFSGYLRALEAVDANISYYYSKSEEDFALGRDFIEAVEESRADIIYLANPSNPTGRLIDEELLQAVVKVCEKKGIFLMLDECFIELTGKGCELPGLNLLKNSKYMVILRAMTKTYAIPGVRLGYALGGNSIITDDINRQLPEWNLSVFAANAGIAALTCSEYVDRARELIASERIFLREGLNGAGIRTFASDANYILFFYKDYELGNKLLKRGILIRDCSDYEGLTKGYYRIAVKNHEENVEFLEILNEVISNA